MGKGSIHECWEILGKEKNSPLLVQLTETAAQRRSVKKMFLDISHNSQEHTCAQSLF